MCIRISCKVNHIVHDCSYFQERFPDLPIMIYESARLHLGGQACLAKWFGSGLAVSPASLAQPSGMDHVRFCPKPVSHCHAESVFHARLTVHLLSCRVSLLSAVADLAATLLHTPMHDAESALHESALHESALHESAVWSTVQTYTALRSKSGLALPSCKLGTSLAMFATLCSKMRCRQKLPPAMPLSPMLLNHGHPCLCLVVVGDVLSHLLCLMPCLVLEQVLDNYLPSLEHIACCCQAIQNLLTCNVLL